MSRPPEPRVDRAAPVLPAPEPALSGGSLAPEPDAMALAKLILGAAARDVDAFSELFGILAPKVKAHLLSAGASPDAAEAGAQDALVAVWRSAAAFDPAEADAATWLYRIVREQRVSLQAVAVVLDPGAAPAASPRGSQWAGGAKPPGRTEGDQIRIDQGALFLGDGGEMGALTRAYDWAASDLGAPGGWPQSLKTAVRLMLTSRHPMFIWWGPDLLQFYNDAYRTTMGPERHPSALGDRGRDCWAEIWEIIGPQIELVMNGEGSTWHEDQLVPVTRNGAREAVWWTYGYSPIDDGDGVGGVLVVCNDVTVEHLAREALAVSNAAQALALERHTLLGDELHHRVKNTLATVVSLARLSARGATSVEDFTSGFTARVNAMAKTHDLMRSGRPGEVRVADILDLELRPYLGSQGQARMTCEAMAVQGEAAVSLALIVHELLTNALKHGGLAVPEGRLAIDCRRSASGATLHWLETVQQSEAPGPPGLGGALIDRLARSLGGGAIREVRAAGMEATIRFRVD